MTSRRLPLLRDVLTATPTRLLNSTFAELLPVLSKWRPIYLPYGYHLIYFPPPIPLSQLLSDGTDPVQSPGGLFTQRMWAGGSIEFHRGCRIDNSASHCFERIKDVQVKGLEQDQKIFVQIERNIYPRQYPREVQSKTPGRADGSLITEIRSLVFMHKDRPKVFGGTGSLPDKILKPTQTPDFSHDLVPTPALLFRFSALTFNAHAIHLDKQYCREIEGHRNLLVHGPLSLILILQFLAGRLVQESKGRADNKYEKITSIKYRNIAPLYAEEKMKICIKRKEQCGPRGSWDAWIEGRDGGYAVKGIVKTIMLSNTRETRGRPERKKFSTEDVVNHQVEPKTASEMDGNPVNETTAGDENTLKSEESQEQESSPSIR